MVDLPDPFGPMTRFIFGPGKNSAFVYVTKFFRVTRTMDPGSYLSKNISTITLNSDAFVSAGQTFLLGSVFVCCAHLEKLPVLAVHPLRRLHRAGARVANSRRLP